MQQQVVHFFEQHPQTALWSSLALNVLIAVLGLIPSFFLTAANIAFFGFWEGTAISFAGESLGALISFLLYRRGFRRKAAVSLQHFPKLRRLLAAQGSEAFGLVLSLRLLPFVPSGLITFAAAIGRISTGSFLIASTIGKAPALLLEAWSVYQVTRFNSAGKIILAIAAFALLYGLIKKRKPQPPEPSEPSEPSKPPEPLNP